MAKYFYVYDNGEETTDCIVKMFNGDNGAVVEKVLPKDKAEGFCEGLILNDFNRSDELANADMKEVIAKAELVEKMNAYHLAKDAYNEANNALKMVKEKLGL